jgi:hypothetical protein
MANVRGSVRSLIALFLANLILNPLQAGQVKLAWTRSPDASVVSQKVYYGFATNALSNVVLLSSTATNTTVSSLADGSLYYFAVTAVDGNQVESDFSNIINVPTTVTTGGSTVPVATSKTVSVAEDQTVSIQLTGTDPNSDPLTFTVTTLPRNGTLTGTPPSLTYRPNSNFSGSDSFTYVAFDGLNTSLPATVTINVTPINDAPTLNSISSQTVSMNSLTKTVSLSGITAGAGESQTLTVTANSSNSSLIAPTVSYTSPNTTGTVSFKPATNQVGTATVTVTVSDGQTSTQRSFLVTVQTPPPTVSNATLVSNDARTLTVEWNTDQASTCTLEFGTTTSYGSSSASTPSGTKHTITVTDLQPATLYYLRVRAVNSSGAISTTAIGTDATESISVITKPAESATLSNQFLTYTSATALDGKYISGSKTNLSRATFTVTTPDGLNYRLWARAKGPTGGGSFYVSVDGGAEILFNIPQNGSANPFRWLEMNPSGEVLLPLAAGTHQLSFRPGVANTQLDEIVLNNDPSWLPILGTTQPLLTLTAPSTSSVVLTWDAMADNADYVNVEISTDGATFTRYATLPGSQTTLTIQNLSATTHYYFRAYAYDSVESTAYSNEAERPALL